MHASLLQADEQAAARKDGLPGWFANLIDVKVPAIRSHDASARCLDMACSDIMRTGQGSDILDESDEPYAWMDIDDFTTTPVLPAGTFDEPSIFINGFPAGSGAYQRLLAFNVQRDGFTPSIADLTEEAPTATVSVMSLIITCKLWDSRAVASLSSVMALFAQGAEYIYFISVPFAGEQAGGCNEDGAAWLVRQSH
jgi:hypothetical protein